MHLTDSVSLVCLLGHSYVFRGIYIAQTGLELSFMEARMTWNLDHPTFGSRVLELHVWLVLEMEPRASPVLVMVVTDKPCPQSCPLLSFIIAWTIFLFPFKNKQKLALGLVKSPALLSLKAGEGGGGEGGRRVLGSQGGAFLL